MTARAAATALLLVLLPCSPAVAADRDRDRMPDGWERRHHLSKPGRDADRDGLTNLREYRVRTNPRRRDSDRDGLRDRDELRFGWHPRRRDSDHDGVRDGDENAGVVAAVDGRQVTIRLAAGGRLGAVVEDPQALSCVPALDAVPPVAADPAPDAADPEQEPFWDPDWGDRPDDLDADDGDAPLARAAQGGVEEEDADSADEDVAAEPAAGDDCRASLRVGALVHEATVAAGALTRLRLVG